jgi:hypothetical protein
VPRAELATDHLCDLNAAELFDFVRNRATAVKHVPVAGEFNCDVRVAAHGQEPGQWRALVHLRCADDFLEARVGNVFLTQTGQVWHMGF